MEWMMLTVKSCSKVINCSEPLDSREFKSKSGPGSSSSVIQSVQLSENSSGKLSDYQYQCTLYIMRKQVKRYSHTIFLKKMLLLFGQRVFLFYIPGIRIPAVKRFGENNEQVVVQEVKFFPVFRSSSRKSHGFLQCFSLWPLLTKLLKRTLLFSLDRNT